MFLDGFSRFKSLIGRGVAIRHPNGLVKKHKILSLKLYCDKEGARIKGVELDMTKPDLMQFTNKDVVWSENGHSFFHPIFLYRNKGECARAYAEEEIERLEKNAALWKGEYEASMTRARNMKRLAEDAIKNLAEAKKVLGRRKKWCKIDKNSDEGGDIL